MSWPKRISNHKLVIVILRVITNISYGRKVKSYTSGTNKFEKLTDGASDQKVRVLVIIVGRPGLNQIIARSDNQHIAVQ